MRHRGISGAAALVAATLALTACASGSDEGTAPAAGSSAAASVKEPVAITYDGGIFVLDGEALKVAHNVTLPGFNRVNSAGNDTGVFVSTESGFQVLDAAAGKMTDISYPGAKPGHVVRHGDRTILFTDGTGEVHSFDPKKLADGKPEGRTYKTAQPHHGVAVELPDGTLLVTLGTEESRSGAIALDKDGKEVARSEECPGVHGEAVAQGEIVGLGCKDGVLLFKNGAFVKVKSAGAYGAVGTQAGSEKSPVLLGDYKVEPDAEREFPEQFALIDTAAQKLQVVPMPEGVSYSFRSLGRGPKGEGLILGTDGKLHVIDPATGKLTSSWPVVGAWKEPMEWQEPRPALFVRGDDAYVTEPATKKVHRLDLTTGKIVGSVTLDAIPNEISGTSSGH
ncbi:MULTISPECIES: zinc metallochaperone AztD [unclassified Micromonospora]|uniref:zinc metallochaperone AztD n=1 Tax=unclassified Micromonospora TaxID=2617518 RepID=UPI00259D094B|nr:MULTISPECIES: zinc metallochaperone AztD [unclassified Micromonospora]MDM4781134.1 zinc metallochaperone AztD [Micromonospora sp. b486]